VVGDISHLFGGVKLHNDRQSGLRRFHRARVLICNANNKPHACSRRGSLNARGHLVVDPNFGALWTACDNVGAAKNCGDLAAGHALANLALGNARGEIGFIGVRIGWKWRSGAANAKVHARQNKNSAIEFHFLPFVFSMWLESDQILRQYVKSSLASILLYVFDPSGSGDVHGRGNCLLVPKAK